MILPKLSALMQKGKIDGVHISDGDFIKKDEVIVTISAEKANVDITSPIDGYVKLQCRVGDELPVGSVLAFVADNLEEFEELQDSRRLNGNAETETAVNTEIMAASDKKAPIRAMPIAKRIAKEKGIDLSTIKGTGPNGMIRLEDVKRAIESNDQDDQVLELSAVKKGMFEHMERAKAYVQGTTFMEVDMGHIKELRVQNRQSYTSFVAAAVIRALTNHPLINSVHDNGKIIIKKHINLGVALDNQGKLFVPVIKNAQNMGVKDIEEHIKKFRGKVVANKITMDDLSGGTFTVTNSGIFGSLCFAPVINYPQSAILGMGGIVDRPVVRNNGITIRPIMIISLSYDHRIIEGSVAVKFLAEVKQNLETFVL